LGLAVPVAQVVASGALMRAGIIVKDGSAIERLATIDHALLDKTGTLTLGSPQPDSRALDTLSETEARAALTLASHSRHPFSRALSTVLSARGVVAVPIDGIEERPGEGMFGRVDGVPVALRRPDTGSGSAVALEIDGRPAQLIRFSDHLRPEAAAALARLRAMGVDCSILSGDSPEAVNAVAETLGLPAQGNVRPAEKQDIVAGLRAGGHKVLMVGDGLNDGPALAAADASIAPGSASDVGLQAADFVFVQDSLMPVARAVAGARRTMSVVRQNFGLAIGYNVLAVPLAMAGFVTPLIAAVAMSASSLIVIANSLRLARAAR